MEHFLNPRNKGKLKDANAVGRVGNPICGDVMYIYIKVENGKIADIGWETMGCAAAIATSSMVSELAKGKKLEDAMKIGKKDIADALEGLPPIKMHCSNLASEGLHKAIRNYLNKDRIIQKFKEVVGEKDAKALYMLGISDFKELKDVTIEEIAKTLSKEGLEKLRKYFRKWKEK